MFSVLIGWYTANAAVVFVALTGSAICLEQLRRQVIGTRDEVGSIRTSLTSALAFVATKSLLSKAVVTSVALFLYEHYRIFTLDLLNPWVWIGVLVLRDFIYYWVHRAEHRIRLLWASHMVHHSPETIGFTTAVRVPWMEAVYKPWLGLWLPLIGFHPVAAIALDVLAATMAQMYHTDSVRRLPIVDKLLVTPSAHRVHHGSNPEYIDKNFGAVFIVWDKLFGTFEPEVAQVTFGIGTKRIDTPVKALVGGYPALVAEMRSIVDWRARLRHAFAAPV